MKKTVIWLFCVILVSFMAVPAFAAQQIQFTVTPSKTTAAPGEEITFSVKVTGSECVSLGYIPEYDKDVLEMVSGECTAENTALADFSKSEGGVLLYKKATAPDGEVFRFVMRVKEDAAAGEVTVSGDVAAKNGGTVVSAKLTEARLTIASSDTVENDTSSDETQSVQQTEGTSATEQPATGDAPEQTDSKDAPEQTEGSLANSEGTTAAEQSQTPADSEGNTAQDRSGQESGAWWIWVVIAVVVAGAAVTVILLIKKKKA